ncbi:hypothetical protein DKX38_015819 [Salix brachista]|uniref:Protein kinase domain-containing protein n=1 Tax=Salix brachista TaxID=2182728 RepID=A0A5N5L8B6_9ROSI|nr:hypothetical protein DKX38_015819 [Salix brachista]
MVARKKIALFCCVGLLIYLWNTAYGELTPAGVNFEVEALMGIKASLHDPRDVLKWDEHSVDPCSWIMVTCSTDGFVTTLGAPSQSLSGTLSPSIGNLTNLQSLLLQDNNISGHIPAELGKLPNLKTIDLSSNNFSGQIPSTLSNLNSLHYLRLNNNSLNGAIPASLANITQLTFLDLSYNNLNTPVPPVHAKTFNIVGNTLICGAEQGCAGTTPVPQSLAVHNSQMKRLKDGNAIGGEIQFQTEVEMISLAVHRNLLRLYGLCMTTTERLLVYPYMSNGSVATRLKAKPVLDWGTRKRVALGAGRGLLYLHEQCDPKIIHRDVKAANILLDDYCEAVVGDFGLAKLLDHQDSHVTTAVRGTVGHIAPEYLSTGQSSEKTDVFGFGILLLELISGLRALEFGKSTNQKGALLDWVKKLHQEKKLELLVDKDLKNNYDPIELDETVRVALLCTQYLPGQRPKMSEVVRMLEGDGLAEKWEASQRAEATRTRTIEFSSSERYSDLTDDSSLIVQAMELSGPR